MNINKPEIEKANKDLTSISWKDPNYEQYINENYDLNALDYFANSSFYEKNSINEKCRRQNIDFNTSHYQFTGIEFVLEPRNVNSDPDVYIISKNYRLGPNSIILISYYYICKGVIYQSPSLFNVLTRNIENLSNNMLMMLKTVKEK